MLLISRLAVLAFGLFFAFESLAFGEATPDEEIYKRLEVSSDVSMLGQNALGDAVNLQTGVLSLSATDVSLRGNSSLPVAIGRSYQQETYGQGVLRNGEFGDWILEIPRIETVRASNDGWTLASGSQCGGFTPSGTSESAGTSGVAFEPHETSQGNFLIIPGSGSQELLVRDSSLTAAPENNAANWPYVTENNWAMRCDNSGTSPVFIVRSPNGTTYRFKHHASYNAPILKKAGAFRARNRFAVYPDEITDRFGNKVTYTFNGSQLQSIQDDISERLITLTYYTAAGLNGLIKTVNADGEIWQYNYIEDAMGRDHLEEVVQPDLEKWSYDLVDLTRAHHVYEEEVPLTEGEKSSPSWCADDSTSTDANLQSPGTPTIFLDTQAQASGQVSATITGPSGLTGTFVFTSRRNPRTNVPFICAPSADPGSSSTGAHSLYYTIAYDTIALKSKTLTGPGLPASSSDDAYVWTYSVADSDPNDGIEGSIGYFEGATGNDTRWVEVTDPQDVKVRKTYRVTMDWREGQLVQDEVLSGTTTVRTTSYDYTEGFRRGTTPIVETNHATKGKRRLTDKRTIIEDGTSFIREVLSRDTWERATQVKLSNTATTDQKTSNYTFHDDTYDWVIGKPDTLTVDNKVVYDYSYSSNHQVTGITQFGVPAGTFAYDQNTGLLTSATDPLTNTTSFSGFERGIPGRIDFADGTFKLIDVNSDGTIASITDELGNETAYSWGPMKRLEQISYPNTSWTSQNIALTKVTSSSYVPGGSHYKQTITQANYKKETYFDAMLRPLMSIEKDTSGMASAVYSRAEYNADNQVTFSSYPSFSNAETKGVRKFYSALGRLVRMETDTEIYADSMAVDPETGVSTSNMTVTVFDFVNGYIKETTDSHLNTTRVVNQVFGSPGFDNPVRIEAPQDQTTIITRDVFGNMLTATQQGVYSGTAGAEFVSHTRNYVYDSNMRLCKIEDPETGHSYVAYDDAGNVDWTAVGFAGTSDICDRTAVPGTRTDAQPNSNPKVFRSYDTRNRLVSVDYHDGVTNDINYTYDDAGNITSLRVGDISTPSANDITWTYSYNNRSLLTTESLTVEGGSAIDFIYDYNPNQQLSQLTYPSGRVLALYPDAFGRATRLGKLVHSASYHETGALQSMTYANGMVRNITINTRGLPEQIADAAMDFSYDYDGRGNLKSVTQQPLNGGVTNNQTFHYDALNRLTQAEGEQWGTALYEYDPLNNVRYKSFSGDGLYNAMPAREQVYEYDPNTHRLTGIVDGPSSSTYTHTFAYDDNGNVTSRNSDDFNFDIANRMLGVTGVAGYRYDGNGRRAKIVDQTSSETRVMAYTSDGKIRYEHNLDTGEKKEFYYLAGTLVAQMQGNPNEPSNGALSVDKPANDGNFTVSWSGTNATGYKLYERGPGAADWTEIPVTGTSKSFANKAAGTWNYRFQTCNDTEGCDFYSDTLNVGVWPDSPTTIGVTDSGASQVSVTWGPSDSSVSHYTAYQQINGGTKTEIYSGTDRSASANVADAGTHVFSVEACNVYGCSVEKVADPYGVVPYAPSITNPTGSQDSDGSFTVAWSSEDSATSYELERMDDSTPWAQIYAGGNLAHAEIDLSANSYDYRARACNSHGCGSWSSTKHVNVLPDVPALTVPADGSGQSFTVSWTGSAGATSYTLQQQFDGGSWNGVYTGGSLSKSITLSQGGSYAYRIRACRDTLCSAYSAASTVGVIPSLPNSINATIGDQVLDEQEIDISWNTSADAGTVVVQRLRSGESWAGQYSGSASQTTSTFLASQGGDYTFRIQACNTYGCSAFIESNTVTIAPNDTLFSISASKVGSNGIDVSWDQQLSGATSFTVQQQLDSGSWTTAYSGGNRTLSLTSLAPGQYRYRAQGCNSAGCTTYKYSSIIDILPATPASISTPSTDADQSFGVSWTASSGANSYTLQQQFNSGSWSTIYTGSNTSRSVSVSSGGDYRYRVRACHNTLCSSYKTSNNVGVYPATPSSISVPGTDYDGSYSVSWASSAGATHYILREKSLSTGNWTTMHNGTGTSDSFSSQPVDQYDYIVKACNTHGCSSYRGSSLVTVPPATPALTTPTTDADGNYSVSWNSTTGATSYTLQERAVGGTWSTVQSSSGSQKQSTGKSPGGWEYRVQACFSGGCSQWSGIKTVGVTPPAPASLTAPDIDYDGGFSISWSSSTGATSYEAKERKDGSSWYVIYTGSGTSKSRSLSPGDYDFVVKACNSYGCSAWTYNWETNVPPPAPIGLSAPSQDTDGNFSISWYSVSSATSYVASRRLNGGSWSNHSTTTGTSQSESGLGQGSWDFRVRSCGTGGCGSWSGIDSTVVEYPPPASTVSSPAFSSSSSYTVSWTASSGAQQYQLQESVLSGGSWGSWNAKYTGSATSTGVYNSDGNYRYRVRACKSFACSAWSASSVTEVGTGGGGCFGSLSTGETTDGTDGTESTTGNGNGKGQNNGQGNGGGKKDDSGDGDLTTLAGPGC